MLDDGRTLSEKVKRLAERLAYFEAAYGQSDGAKTRLALVDLAGAAGVHDPLMVVREAAADGQRAGKAARSVSSSGPGGDRPRIQTNDRQLRDVIEDAWEIVLAGNVPPSWFIRCRSLARLRSVDGRPELETVTKDVAFGHLLRSASWMRAVKRKGGAVEEVDTKPDKDIAVDMVSNPDGRLPMIEAVVETPVFDEGGALVAEQGYNEPARLWLDLGDLKVPPVSAAPCAAEVEQAKAWLLEELLVDFRFARPSDRAHAVAVMLLPFARRMVRGCAPMHLIEAPTPGTGKGKLARCIGIVASGRAPAPMTSGSDSAELRKRITAALDGGRQFILIDNISDHLDSADLAAALTAEVWADRVLGAGRIVELPNRATWLLTANNPSMSLEVARRCIRIRIEAASDRPWERRGFRHEDVEGWALEHRGDLVWSCLTLIQSWVASGRKPCRATLGSFESWAGTIGGILGHVGVEGFLADQEALYESADRETTEWQSFIGAWWGVYEGAEVTAKDLYRVATERDLLLHVLGDKGERSQMIRLGKALGAMRGRWFGGLQLIRAVDSHTGMAKYRLAKAIREEHA